MAKAIEFWQKAIDGGNDSATLRKKLKLKEIRRRMKKTKILLISMTALLLAACGTKKAVIQQKPVQDTKVTQPTVPAPRITSCRVLLPCSALLTMHSTRGTLFQT